MSREKVLLTGFGPFGDHNINPSWEVVKELSSKYGKYYEELGIELITQELPVDYKFVQNEVPRLWEEHQPKLVIHLGVHGETDKILLETGAFNKDHLQKDINGFCPKNGCCVRDPKESLDCLQTELDLKLVVEEIKEKHPDCPVIFDLSWNPGRYLCNFSYFCSLKIDCCRSMFIHIPPADKPFSIAQMTEGLHYVIQHLITQIDKKTKLN